MFEEKHQLTLWRDYPQSKAARYEVYVCAFFLFRQSCKHFSSILFANKLHTAFSSFANVLHGWSDECTFLSFLRGKLPTFRVKWFEPFLECPASIINFSVDHHHVQRASWTSWNKHEAANLSNRYSRMPTCTGNMERFPVFPRKWQRTKLSSSKNFCLRPDLALSAHHRQVDFTSVQWKNIRASFCHQLFNCP